MKSNTQMLQLNKHFMQHFGLVADLPIPRDVTASAAAPAPVKDCAAERVTVTTHGETIQVHVHMPYQKWVRLPERRSRWRRIEVANCLRETAETCRLDTFLRYIADCGFVVQP